MILIGHAGHPEVIGTLGQIPDKFHLVSSVKDVEELRVENTVNLSYVTQTTLSVDECRDIVGALHQRFPNIKGPHQEDICYATQNRQNAVKELSRLVDVILVIGSPNSSNSNRLRDWEQCGIPSPDRFSCRHRSCGCKGPRQSDCGRCVSSGNPGHGSLHLRASEPSDVEELTVIEEDVEFLLPKELVQIESSKKPVGSIAG